MPSPSVSVESVTKRFSGHTAVNRLSLQVSAGGIFGLLGPNGAGKSTTIRLIMGILEPDEGSVSLFGSAHGSRKLSARIGYLPEERGLYKKESVIDVMVYFGRLKGLGAEQARRWSRAYLERVGIGEKEKVRLDKLSGGQQQKVQLGVTIMNDPELLILDEPTKGFDPVNRRLLMDIIDDQKRAGSTVMMVTHQMEEVERLCDRVILLKDGTSRAYGTVEEVQEQFGGTIVHVDHDGALPASASYRVLSDADGHAQLEPADGADAAGILRELVDAGVRVTRFAPTRKSLDDIFVEVYGAQSQED